MCWGLRSVPTAARVASCAARQPAAALRPTFLMALTFLAPEGLPALMAASRAERLAVFLVVEVISMRRATCARACVCTCQRERQWEWGSAVVQRPRVRLHASTT